MIRVDYSKFKNQPRDGEQAQGIEFILNEAPGRNAAVFDQVGFGKSYAMIMVASVLHEEGLLDAVLVLCPANGRGVWDDPLTGQLQEHSWLEYSVTRIDAGYPELRRPRGGWLRWYVASYPFARNPENVARLARSIQAWGGRVMLVADESSHIKNHQAHQAKGAISLRHLAASRAILNASPAPNNVMDYWSQFKFLDERALKGRNWYAFRSRFARMGGYMGKNVVGIQNEEELAADLKPWVLMRRRSLPETYGVLPVQMPDRLHAMYQDMNSKLVAWLEERPTSVTHAGNKVLRLAQLTSGFLGGFRDEECAKCDLPLDLHGPDAAAAEGASPCDEFIGRLLPPIDVDDSKTEAVMEFILEHPELSGIVWSRFTAEIDRMAERLRLKGIDPALVYGKNVGRARQQDINDLMTGRKRWGVIQVQAGSEALNLPLADVNIFMSRDYSWKNYYQAKGRARPREGHPVLHLLVLMTAPGGKKTVDHAIEKKVGSKEATQEYTAKDWIRELQ